MLSIRCSYIFQLTLSRPKGPSSRKKPRRFSAPEDTPTEPMVSLDAKKSRSYEVLGTWSSSLGNGEWPQAKNEEAETATMGHTATTIQFRRGAKGDPTHEEMKKENDEILSSGSSVQDHLTLQPPISTSKVLHSSTSADSTPSGSPAIKKGWRLPQVDLTSLAPEQKQTVSGVRKGWSEGGGAKEDGKAREVAAPRIKDVSRKIHG